jgi:hypothetical protein
MPVTGVQLVKEDHDTTIAFGNCRLADAKKEISDNGAQGETDGDGVNVGGGGGLLVLVGVFVKVGEGVWLGVEDGVWDGVTEDVSVGVSEGVCDGVWEGVVDGVEDGVCDGVWEGVADGVGDSVCDGVVVAVNEGVSVGGIGEFVGFEVGEAGVELPGEGLGAEVSVGVGLGVKLGVTVGSGITAAVSRDVGDTDPIGVGETKSPVSEEGNGGSSSITPGRISWRYLSRFSMSPWTSAMIPSSNGAKDNATSPAP